MSAYDEGFKARQCGRDPSLVNPYRAWSQDWFDFADGWRDLDQHLRERDQAFAFTFEKLLIS